MARPKKIEAPKELEVVAESPKDFVQVELPLIYQVNLAEGMQFSLNGVLSGVPAGEQEVTAEVYEILKNAGRI